jgi:hypothetical protein
MVELIPNGARYADGNTDLLHQIRPPGSTSAGTFRLSGFLPYTAYSTPVSDYETTVSAVRNAGDDAAAVLHELDDEYAPFFCRHCRRSYCGRHWNLGARFDHGFDYYSGTCPFGHRKFIDH